MKLILIGIIIAAILVVGSFFAGYYFKEDNKIEMSLNKLHDEHDTLNEKLNVLNQKLNVIDEKCNGIERIEKMLKRTIPISAYELDQKR